MTTTEDEARRFWHDNCFGDRFWQFPGPNGKTSQEMLVEAYMGNRALAAMSMLSDAQELIDSCRSRDPGIVTNARLESARQIINKAKSILSDFSTEFHVQQMEAAGVKVAIDGTILEEAA